MVDLRKLVNEVIECCEVEMDFEGDFKASCIGLKPDLETKLNNLVNGLDEIEKEMKKLREEISSMNDLAEEIADSMY